jgi:hypothetical protein
MKKTIYTLNVDNYAPDICALTYPFIDKYAKKIGADFHVINERKYPDMPVTYEKLQVKELAEKAGNDWSIYIDSDTLVHPDTIDFTCHIHKDTVMHNGSDMANIRWRYDEVFLRDGRDIGSCNWLAIASDWCLDLWSPLDITLDQALDNIHPISIELANGITKEHLIDDYTLSRNIAKYGLKFITALDLMRQKGIESASFFWHQYTVPADEKVVEIRKNIKLWGL